jgi:hypothetical protein
MKETEFPMQIYHNFFDAIRSKINQQNSPIEMGTKSQMLRHYANIASRIEKPFQVDAENGWEPQM